MAAPFKIKSTRKSQLYFVTYDGHKKFSSKRGEVAARVYKELRGKIEWPEDLKLVRKTTTTETLIVP